VAGYEELIDGLEAMLVECTGYDAVSLQPNSGAQGEYAGLLAIRAYHASRGEGHRDICLIPESAHGTNPASAQMCGMQVVVTKCDANGNVDVEDIRRNAEKHSERLAAIMMTYPSTHGVFEEDVVEICDIIHTHGGQVYTDGANMNALVGVAKPGKWGSRRIAPQPAQDLLHPARRRRSRRRSLRGEGAPGAVPAQALVQADGFRTPGTGNGAMVSAASFGSASILPISWMYIAMMGATACARRPRWRCSTPTTSPSALSRTTRRCTPAATGWSRTSASSTCVRSRTQTGISAEDVAKRLIDFGFHAPTLSFPVAGTLMVEPTESNRCTSWIASSTR
jgi:glycine dehydrogenase